MDNNNHSTGASTDRQRESVNRLDLSPDGREKPGEGVDENDKTKSKYFLVFSDFHCLFVAILNLVMLNFREKEGG